MTATAELLGLGGATWDVGPNIRLVLLALISLASALYSRNASKQLRPTVASPTVATDGTAFDQINAQMQAHSADIAAIKTALEALTKGTVPK